MKIKLLLFSLFFSNFNLFAQQIVDTKVKQNLSKKSATFEENKGQMKDQNWKPRPDVLFYGNQEGMNYYIKNNGVSFQLSRVDSWREEDNRFGMPEIKKSKVPDLISTYRVDANWIDYNPNFTVERGKALDGYNNYYNVPDGVEPALFVKKHESVTLKNVWKGVDIHYYGTDGQLETDYLVAPGADYHQIKLNIEGAKLSINEQGILIMKTPFGEIQEGELKVFQGNERLHAFWKIDDNNKVSFEIPNYNSELALRIDPVTRVWGTYYGGSDDDSGSALITDSFGNIFLAGLTWSTTNIASGGHQNIFGGQTDAYLTKINSNGVRQWGTYYGGGGNGWDRGTAISTDASGNVYLAGSTQSLSGIASGGYQDSLAGGLGGIDAFLVKFSSSGLRIWGTYYGGIGGEGATSVSTDTNGNVYMAGSTNSSSAISIGGHQNVIGGNYDAFLVKFNSSGVRQWGTYYGGLGRDNANSIITNSAGYIYMVGFTDSTSSIASGGHQNTYGGGGDAFLVKFNGNGVRQWGTYYGGSGFDAAYSVATDPNGSVYIAGDTKSSSAIAIGGHQNIYGGAGDAFLVKFNSGGVRQWGTYYGASGGDAVGFTSSLNINAFGDIYMSGGTNSTDSIAIGGYQNFCGGGADAFFVKFNSGGVRQFASYYGGISNEGANCIITDSFRNIYIAGGTNGTAAIASGGHQNNYGGGNYDAYLVKFSETFIVSQPPTTINACPNWPTTLSLSATGSGLTYQWQMKAPSAFQFTNVPIGGTNNFANVNSANLTIGNPIGLNGYLFQCIVANGNVSETSTTVTLTVYNSLQASITADGVNSNPVSINLGDVTSLVLNGSFNTTNPNIVWTPSAGLSSTNVANPFAYPTVSTNYTATFTNSFGCTQSVSQQVNVTSLPNNGSISVTSVAGQSTFSIFDTVKVQINLNGASNIYAAYARLRYSGALAPYLTFIGYTAGTILGTGSSVISTSPVASGTYGYDFGISKIGAATGYSGTGTLYTFYFKPNNIPLSLLGGQVCFYVDNLSITNATTGGSVGLVNQGPYCFNNSSQIAVWPGDLDNNKTVNTADLLKIGIFYNNTGPIRPNSSLQWIAQPATLWGTNTSSPNSDAFKVFVDGNGDGIINNADQTSIGFNMGKVHALAQPMDSVSFDRITTTGNLVIVPTPGYVSASAQSQLLDLSVSLSNAGSTLNDLYGISFDIAVDTNVFDLQNTTFDYSGSIFGIPSQSFLNIEYVANGIVSVGMTRFNNSSINGNGLLCKIKLNTYPGLNYSGTNLSFNGTVSAANDSIGMPYAISPAVVQIPYGSSSSITEIGEDISQVLLYPNPVGELLNVLMSDEIYLKEIKVLDETGRLVDMQAPNRKVKSYTLSTSSLATGIYTLQLITKEGQKHLKFIKEGN